MTTSIYLFTRTFYIHMYMYICLPVHAHVFAIQAFVELCAVETHTFPSSRQPGMYMCTCIIFFLYTYLHTCMFIYINTYMYMYTRTYTYV